MRRTAAAMVAAVRQEPNAAWNKAAEASADGGPPETVNEKIRKLEWEVQMRWSLIGPCRAQAHWSSGHLARRKSGDWNADGVPCGGSVWPMRRSLCGG